MQSSAFTIQALHQTNNNADWSKPSISQSNDSSSNQSPASGVKAVDAPPIVNLGQLLPNVNGVPTSSLQALAMATLGTAPASFANSLNSMAMISNEYATRPDDEAKEIEYRNTRIAAFTIDGNTMICLPQAYELFLKDLVGGLHTVYTKLKRLDIQPRVCNVEQVRALRSLGAIQPGVNRCKLIRCDDFDTLYEDCTTSNRNHHLSNGANRPKPIKRANSPSIVNNVGVSVPATLFETMQRVFGAKKPKLEEDDKKGAIVPPQMLLQLFKQQQNNGMPVLNPSVSTVHDQCDPLNLSVSADSGLTNGVSESHNQNGKKLSDVVAFINSRIEQQQHRADTDVDSNADASLNSNQQTPPAQNPLITSLIAMQAAAQQQTSPIDALTSQMPVQAMLFGVYTQLNDLLQAHRVTEQRLALEKDDLSQRLGAAIAENERIRKQLRMERRQRKFLSQRWQTTKRKKAEID